MCLVLAESDRLLFMGDIERTQIKRVVRDLVYQGATNYSALVTPHHGTHWDESLA
jgi:beta-lactamase superfamily II metal-dependent hydrolase